MFNNIILFVIIIPNVFFFNLNHINLVVDIIVPKVQKIIDGIEVDTEVEMEEYKNVVPFTSILDLVESTYSMLKKCLLGGM